jgi:hypothetical protein
MIKQYYKSIGVKNRKQDVITFVNTVITLPDEPIKVVDLGYHKTGETGINIYPTRAGFGC